MSDVAASLHIRPHAVVHRGKQNHGRNVREKRSGEKIIRMPMRGPRHEIGGGRRDNENVGFFRETNVVQCVPRTKYLGVDASAGDGLEGDGTDKFQGAARHHYIDKSARLSEQTGEHDRLVACDSPGYAEENPAAVEWPHDFYSVRRRGTTRY